MMIGKVQRTLIQLLISAGIMVLFWTLPLKVFSWNAVQDSAEDLSLGYKYHPANVKAMVQREYSRRKGELNEHQVLLQQSRQFVLIKNELESARILLKQGYGYTDINNEIDRLIGWKRLAGEGVITDKDKYPTVRNLTTSTILLKELLSRTSSRTKQVIAYHRSLGNLQYRLDSLMLDSSLYHVPTDSIGLARYFQKVIILGKDLQPIGNQLKSALDTIQKIEIRVNMLKFSLESDIMEAEAQRRALLDKIGILEVGTFMKSSVNDYSIREVISFSFRKAGLVLLFYSVNHIGALVLMLFFLAGIALYLIMLRRKNVETTSQELSLEEKLVLSHPLAVATLISLTLFQFVLPMQPSILRGLVWMTCGISLSFIMWKSIPPLLYKTWIIFFLLYFLSLMGTLLLRQTAFERFTMPVLMTAGLTAGFNFLFRVRLGDIKEKLLLLFIGFLILFEIMGFINYFSGGYNQAKAFMSTGYNSILIAFFLFWTSRLAKQLLYISRRIRIGTEEDPGLFNGEGPSTKAPLYFYLLFFTGWFILVSRNFYF